MKLAVIIIETREVSGLADIIERHVSFLPPNSDLWFFCGPDNKSHFEELKKRIGWAYQIELNIKNIDSYNNNLTDSRFWKLLSDYDRVLVFQSDSMLLRTGVEDFYQYDYVGAPWPWQDKGGNGGLSLRNPKLMQEICEKYPFDTSQGNEDVYFCNVMINKNIGNLAPREVCSKFSVESIFELGSLGYHAIDKWLTPDQCVQIKEQYKNG